MHATGGLDRRRLGAPQPRESERAALLRGVEGHDEEGWDEGIRGCAHQGSEVRREGNLLRICTRKYSAVGYINSCCEKVHGLRTRVEGQGASSRRACNAVHGLKCLFWDTARRPGQANTMGSELLSLQAQAQARNKRNQTSVEL